MIIKVLSSLKVTDNLLLIRYGITKTNMRISNCFMIANNLCQL